MQVLYGRTKPVDLLPMTDMLTVNILQHPASLHEVKKSSISHSSELWLFALICARLAQSSNGLCRPKVRRFHTSRSRYFSVATW